MKKFTAEEASARRLIFHAVNFNSHAHAETRPKKLLLLREKVGSWVRKRE